jgi:hypothetical protein
MNTTSFESNLTPACHVACSSNGFADNLYFVECKNFPCGLTAIKAQYEQQMKFLGKTADIEQYYGLSSKKILVQTNNVHEGLAHNPRPDLRICDRESVVSNLEDVFEWIQH